MRTRTAPIVTATLLLVTGARLEAQRFQDFIAVEGPVIALTNAKVIDGTGAPARLHQTILIDGNRITAVGPTASTAVPLDARVLDLTGHSVIPGLVGLHNHSYYTGGRGRAAQLSFSGSRLYLASGVTTIRTTGARAPYEELNLKREIDAGRAIGPDLDAQRRRALEPEDGRLAVADADEEARLPDLPRQGPDAVAVALEGARGERLPPVGGAARRPRLVEDRRIGQGGDGRRVERRRNDQAGGGPFEGLDDR